MTAEQIIEELNLVKHPEGGFYKETYRSKESIKTADNKIRSTGTAIYYLLKGADKSHFHKINSDEIWLLHSGEPLEIYMITNNGEIKIKILGNNLNLNEEPQVLIPANTWFAAKIKNDIGYAFVSCVVTPGFDFEDFILGNTSELLKMYPALEIEINAFT